MPLKNLYIQSTSQCNMNCSYCYIDSELRQSKKRMQASTIDALFSKVFSSTLVDGKFSILWHSGEPLLAGIDFYEETLIKLSHYNTLELEIDHCFQTNGTLINEKWCELFKRIPCSISISIDGPEFLHNSHRHFWKQKDTFSNVMNGIECLRKNDITYYALCTLSLESLKYPEEIYNFFFKNGFKAIGFDIIERVSANLKSDFDDNPDNFERIRNAFKSFFSTLYDLSVKDKGKLKIRELEDSLLSLDALRKNEDHVTYNYTNIPFSIVTISVDGNISTFSPELIEGYGKKKDAFLIGNIHNVQHLDDLLNQETLLKMSQKINQGVDLCKKTCDYYAVCGGGIPSNKFFSTGKFNSTETTNCKLMIKEMTELILEKCQS